MLRICCGPRRPLNRKKSDLLNARVANHSTVTSTHLNCLGPEYPVWGLPVYRNNRRTTILFFSAARFYGFDDLSPFELKSSVLKFSSNPVPPKNKKELLWGHAFLPTGNSPRSFARSIRAGAPGLLRESFLGQLQWCAIGTRQ